MSFVASLNDLQNFIYTGLLFYRQAYPGTEEGDTKGLQHLTETGILINKTFK